MALVLQVLLWGSFATGLLTLIMSGAQGLGWSRMSLPYMLGTVVTEHRGRAMAAGIAMHFVFGVGFAFIYAFVFKAWGNAGWWRGLLLGLYHGLFMLTVVMQVLPALHPRMASRHTGPTPTRQLEPPGILAMNYGQATPLVTLLGHLVYGLVLGWFIHV